MASWDLNTGDEGTGPPPDHVWLWSSPHHNQPGGAPILGTVSGLCTSRQLPLNAVGLSPAMEPSWPTACDVGTEWPKVSAQGLPQDLALEVHGSPGQSPAVTRLSRLSLPPITGSRTISAGAATPISRPVDGANKQPTAQNRSDAIRIAIAGLASGEQVRGILSKLGALRIRHNSFPARNSSNSPQTQSKSPAPRQLIPSTPRESGAVPPTTRSPGRRSTSRASTPSLPPP